VENWHVDAVRKGFSRAIKKERLVNRNPIKTRKLMLVQEIYDSDRGASINPKHHQD